MKFENEWGCNSTKTFVSICLWKWLKKIWVFFPASLNKPWVGFQPESSCLCILLHSAPECSCPTQSCLSATSSGASSAEHHFLFSGGVLLLLWEEAIAQQGLNCSVSSAQVGWEQCTPSKFKSERNLKDKECVHVVSSFKTFTHFSRADLLLFNPLNHAKT